MNGIENLLRLRQVGLVAAGTFVVICKAPPSRPLRRRINGQDFEDVCVGKDEVEGEAEAEDKEKGGQEATDVAHVQRGQQFQVQISAKTNPVFFRGF